MEIKCTYYRSPTGLLKISGTDKCIVAISFEDVVGMLYPEGSRDIYPILIDCTEQLIEYFQGVRRTFDITLDPRGTEFQQKVWYELMNVAYGKTISYLELSRRLGDTKAARAVAAANGKNPIPIIIPCHRVIGSNQELVGYSGGLWRKRILLDLEKQIAHGVQKLFN